MIQLNSADLTCPFTTAQKVLSGKYSLMIIFHLKDGPIRFNELLRKFDGLTHSSLAKQLKQLEGFQLVHREAYNQVPPRVEYSLTDVGKKLFPAINELTEWGSKYIGLVLRIAGLLHIAADGDGDIQMETVENAIQIGSYAFYHALYAYSILGADETIERALHVVTKLRKLSVTSISRSDLYQKCRGRFFRDAKDMEPVLTLLEQHGYIWMDIPTYSGVGRPSAGTIYINPAALKDDFSA